MNRNPARTAAAIGAVTATLLLAPTFGPIPAAADHDEVPTCRWEDSINCVWDARHNGNGIGISYINLRGHVIKISHRKAHRLTH